MARNTNLARNIQVIQWSPNRTNSKKFTSRHNIIKFLKFKGKKIFQSNWEKLCITYRGKGNWIKVEFLKFGIYFTVIVFLGEITKMDSFWHYQADLPTSTLESFNFILLSSKSMNYSLESNILSDPLDVIDMDQIIIHTHECCQKV